MVASCGSYADLLAAVETHRPDVVLTDIRMPPTQTDEGIRAADHIRTEYPGIGVVVLSQYVEPDYAMRLFADGSDGRAYLLKERVGDIAELSAAIRRVAAGGSVLDPSVVDALIDGRASNAPSVLDRLTEREREVLAEMATGGSNAAIGANLFISPRSVEKHIGSIFTKLDLPETDDVNRRVRAVLVYLAAAAGIVVTDVRVLIVDDQTPFREASKMVVEMTDGFEVVGEAENGEQAVEMAADLRPDLVLMDVQMPGIDGLEATRRIMASDDPPHVLVMSTHESGNFDQPALDAGAFGFLPKSSFSMDALEEVWADIQRR